MVMQVGEADSTTGRDDPFVVSPAPVTLASFEDLYLAEYQSVVRLLVASTGRVDLAEDLAQDSFLAAHRRWDIVSGYDDPAGWVRRVALNAATSAWRRRRTEASALVSMAGRSAPSPPALPAPDDRVWAAVRRLPARQAQVIVLKTVEDRSTTDIARLLGLSENSVRTHLRRARRRLASELGVIDEEDG
jgi:RNA polymerase sigma-70 factor (ECF subfamily)